MAKKPKKDIIISLELERSRINREKSVLVLDKALLLYFSFLFVAVIGFVNGYMKVNTMNILILMSFAVLVVGIAPYWITMRKEERKLDELIKATSNGKSRGVRNG